MWGVFSSPPSGWVEMISFEKAGKGGGMVLSSGRAQSSLNRRWCPGWGRPSSGCPAGTRPFPHSDTGQRGPDVEADVIYGVPSSILTLLPVGSCPAN